MIDYYYMYEKASYKILWKKFPVLWKTNPDGICIGKTSGSIFTNLLIKNLKTRNWRAESINRDLYFLVLMLLDSFNICSNYGF